MSIWCPARISRPLATRRDERRLLILYPWIRCVRLTTRSTSTRWAVPGSSCNTWWTRYGAQTATSDSKPMGPIGRVRTSLVTAMHGADGTTVHDRPRPINLIVSKIVFHDRRNRRLARPQLERRHPARRFAVPVVRSRGREHAPERVARPGRAGVLEPLSDRAPDDGGSSVPSFGFGERVWASEPRRRKQLLGVCTLDRGPPVLD